MFQPHLVDIERPGVAGNMHLSLFDTLTYRPGVQKFFSKRCKRNLMRHLQQRRRREIQVCYSHCKDAPIYPPPFEFISVPF